MDAYSVGKVTGVALALFILYRVVLIIYRLFFHPLAKVPGPWYHAASNIPFLYRRYWKGTWVHQAVSYHERFGRIIRVAPDCLSVDASIAWEEIFSQRLNNKPEFTRHPIAFDKYYAQAFLAFDTAEHRRFRRIFAPAFTEPAVRTQEPVIQKHANLLLEQLSKRQDQPIDLFMWINYVFFDITGELNLGESFHCLERDELHFWVALILDNLRVSSMLRVFEQYPLLKRLLLPLLMTPKVMEKKTTHENIVRDHIARRMSQGVDAKQDFMTHIMKNIEKGTLTRDQVTVNAGLFIVAGSETSAVATSSLVYYLCKEKAAYEELVQEIRSAFASEEDITIASTAKLTYLTLCLKEAMRLHVPAPEILPRRSPGEWVGGYWAPEGTELVVPTHTTSTSPSHFHDSLSFHPERHAAPNSKYFSPLYANDNLAAFQPFAVGPRDCIGQPLAWAQMRLVMAKLLWRYDVEVDWSVSEGWLENQRAWSIWEKLGGLWGVVREREH